MSGYTEITGTQFTNYTSIEALQDIIIRTISRWFNIHGAVWSELECFDGVYILCGIDRIQSHFELFEVREHLYQLVMYAVGSFRRHGSSCDYFEKMFDCLSVQILNPDREFAKMNDCLSIAYPPMNFDLLDVEPAQHIFENPVPLRGALAETVIYSESESEEDEDYGGRYGGYGGNDGGYFDEDEILLTTEDAAVLSEDEDTVASLEDAVASLEDKDTVASLEDTVASLEDDVIMSMPLRNMSDKQIDRYCCIIGECPSNAIYEWTSDFNGGAITRYSYINFADTTISDRRVLNVSITCAIFTGCTLRNVQFEQVHFHRCDFMSVTLDNVTFKDCQFTYCDLDICIDLDNSCSVEFYDPEEEMRQAFLEDNVTYRYC